MEYLKQEIKAGVLITVSFAILCFFLFNVTGMKERAQMNFYTVSFANINGLMENAPVNYAGVKVGKIEWIHIRPKAQDDALVDVGISVKQSIPLCADSKVVISSAGFVGEKYIGIMPGADGGSPLKSGAVIRGVDPTDMVKLIERLNDVLTDLKIDKWGTTFTKIADDAHATILEAKSSFSHINAITREVRESGKVEKALNDVTVLLENVNGTVAENRDSIKASVANVKQISERMSVEGDKILAELRDILKKVDAIVKENRPDIRETVRNTKDFTYVIKREPWRIFRKGDTTDAMLKEHRAQEAAQKKGKPKGFPFIF